MTLPALLGGGRPVAPHGDVVQSGVESPRWQEMTPSGPSRVRGMSFDEFASLVSHELRNPLNAMSGWLHLIGAEPSARGDARARAIAGLRRALDQQLAQVDTLGRVLRLAGGSGACTRAPLDLRGLLASCAEALRETAHAGGRDVRFEDAGGAAAARIEGDAAVLRESLVALGGFALRHGRVGAPLCLRLEGDSAAPVVRISIDEGDDDGGLSVWHGFRAGTSRLSLELLLATLEIEAHGAQLGPSGDGRVGDALLIRFVPSAATARGDGVPSPVRPHA